jgi:hypothetical protein
MDRMGQGITSSSMNMMKRPELASEVWYSSLLSTAWKSKQSFSDMI